MLSEGILHFSTNALSAADDRIRRAHGIAVALRVASATPACAAWLSNIEFNQNRFAEMARHLQEALTLATVDDHQTRARASLVLADAFHFSGSFELARPWYDATRVHATSEGDEATISAMLHNVAAFRAANVSLADAIGQHLPEESRRASLEASSAANYDVAIGTTSFEQLIPLLSGQLLIVERKYSAAMKLISNIELDQLPERLRAVHMADRAVCAMGLGDQDLAEIHGRRAIALLTTATDHDDIAYVSARLSALFGSIGDAVTAMALADRANAAVQSHREVQATLRALLQVTCVTIQQAYDARA